MQAHLVILMDTQVYDGAEHRYVDLPITDVMQMMGRACRPLQDTSGKCNIFCHAPKKDFYKKFLYEPFPVESHLDHYLHDHLNAEVITKRVETVQDAVDYLTWSFYYRRLTQNPNYYNLQGATHRHVSDHLSELVETVLDDLAQSKCITVEDETDVSSLNLGMIAGFYYLRYTTVELFSNALNEKVKLRELLEILSTATEFEKITVRQKEDKALEKLSHHLPLKLSSADFNHSATKTNVLLQAHFSRVPLAAAVAGDLASILPDANRLLQAIVDVISSSRWLAPALAAMELAQMVTMGMWNSDPALMQVPHIDKPLALKCQKQGIKSVADLLEMEDEDRSALLALTPAQMSDVARFANAYPDVGFKFKIADEKVKAGAKVTVNVELEKSPGEDEEDFEEGVTTLVAPRYPLPKAEGFWVVLGNTITNELLVIKRVTLKNKVTPVKLELMAPTKVGQHSLKLFLMCDGWIGADQEYGVELDVQENDRMSDNADEESD